jgi:hypothetical protein
MRYHTVETSDTVSDDLVLSYRVLLSQQVFMCSQLCALCYAVCLPMRYMLFSPYTGRSSTWMKDGVLEGVDAATFVSHFGGVFGDHDLHINNSADGLLVQITVAGTDRRAPAELFYELQLAVTALPGGKLVPLASRQRGLFQI